MNSISVRAAILEYIRRGNVSAKRPIQSKRSSQIGEFRATDSIAAVKN